MSRKPMAYAALTAVLLASSPGFGMSVVTDPTNSRANARLADPANADSPYRPQNRVNGSLQTTIMQNSGSFGYGGRASVSIGTFDSQGRPMSRPDTLFPDSSFLRSQPAIPDLTDPVFEPHGLFAPVPRDRFR